METVQQNGRFIRFFLVNFSLYILFIMSKTHYTKTVNILKLYSFKVCFDKTLQYLQHKGKTIILKQSFENDRFRLFRFLLFLLKLTIFRLRFRFFG